MYGMEPLEGVFSSPEKSPKKRNGVPHNSTIEEEEDMDIGQSKQYLVSVFVALRCMAKNYPIICQAPSQSLLRCYQRVKMER